MNIISKNFEKTHVLNVTSALLIIQIEKVKSVNQLYTEKDMFGTGYNYIFLKIRFFEDLKIYVGLFLQQLRVLRDMNY